MRKERPILFSTEMVKAILDGRKTQTRRVIKPPNKFSKPNNWTSVVEHSGGGWMATDGDPRQLIEISEKGFKCPYGQVGDRLWVRETWRVNKHFDKMKHSERIWIAMNGDVYGCIDYKAKSRKEDFWGRWRSAMFMPRWASRITLEITDIRVERLNNINENDIINEGVQFPKGENTLDNNLFEEWKKLWDSINKKRGYGWEKNPYVWVVEFKKINK